VVSLFFSTTTKKKMQTYPSDLTDSQWSKIKSFFETKRKRKYQMRQVCNAIFYLLKTGCQWRYLPKSFGKWQSIYYYFDEWRRTGVWQRLNDRLRVQCRQQRGKQPSPSAICIDAQSVKTTRRGGVRGFEQLLQSCFGLWLFITLRSDKKKGFQVLPKRWVVERTFDWFGLYRRLSKDYEYHTHTSETMIYIIPKLSKNE
jgi:putative transposase